MEKFYISEILLLDPLKTVVGPLLSPEQEYRHATEAVTAYLTERFAGKAWTQVNFNPLYESFKIEEARRLISEAALQNSFSGQGQRALLLWNFPSASLEAQTAVLKIIEEPPAETLLILPVFTTQNILPTIVSRCHQITLSVTLLDQLRATTQLKETLADSHTNSANHASSMPTFPDNLAAALTITENSKNKAAAQQLCRDWLKQAELSNPARRAILQCLQDLDQNLNPQLALEHCLLPLVAQN